MAEQKRGPLKIELKEAEQIENSKEIIPTQIRHVMITLGGREIPLVYNMRVQLAVEEELEMDFSEFNDKLQKAKRATRLLIGAIRLLGNEGLRRAGKEADLTDDWIMDHMVPIYTQTYRVALIGAVTAGWFMETDNSFNEEQDETLNELRKKNERTE